MPQFSRAMLIGLMLLFVLLATAFSTIIPLGEAADEVSHYSYVRYMAQHWQMPPVQEGTTVLGETFQPPLYYALAAPLTQWLPYGDQNNLGFSNPVESNPDWDLKSGAGQGIRLLLQPAAARWPWQGEALGWHLVRFFSVALGLITIFATYRLALLVFPNEAWTAFLAAALVAFLPSFIGISAAVTNDALATALAALLLWLLAERVTDSTTHLRRDASQKQDEDGQSSNDFSRSAPPETTEVVTTLSRLKWRRGWLLVGLLGGLSVWTKASGWVLVGTTLLGSILASRFGFSAENNLKKERSVGQMRPLWSSLQGLLIAGLTWLVIVLPLWWLNLQRAGDIMGRGIQQEVTEARLSLPLIELWEVVRGLYGSWWAGFGGAVHLHFGAWLEALLLIPLLLAGLGLLRRHLQRHNAPKASLLLIPLLAAHIGLVFAAWLIWTSQVMGTGQGRLLFPALPAIAVLLAGGLMGVFSTQARLTALAWSIGALCLPLAALFTIILPAYRSQPPAIFAPASATTEAWQVDDLPLTLSAFHLPITIDDRIKPGSDTDLYVAWQAEGSLPDVRLRVRWIDRQQKLIAIKEGSPIANHPLTDEWEAGNYAAYHHLHLPLGIEGGWYRLMLSVIDPITGEALPLHGPNQSMGTEIMVGQTTVVEE